MSDAWDLGAKAAKDGLTDEDNPYGPRGRLYDGVDSQAEALAWYKGWKAQKDLSEIQRQLKEDRKIREIDGLDYLESPRD